MKDMYTPREAAAEILAERQSDPELCRKIGRYLGWELPDVSQGAEKPLAVLARYVPRATDEDREFAEIALEAGLTPTWASYKKDRFTVRNAEKVATVRPPIQWSKGQKTKQWIVEELDRQGGVGELQTIYGISSTEYQNRMRQLIFGRDGLPELVGNTFDMSEWYRYQADRFGYEQGGMASYYYQAAMALYAIKGALFEDFDGGPSSGNGDLARFNEEVVFPAFDRVQEELGVRPVIVRLPYRAGMEISNLSFMDRGEAEAVFGESSREGVDE